MKLTIQLAALLLSPTAHSLRCWAVLTQGEDPIQYPLDVTSDYSCSRLSANCTSSLITPSSSFCYGKANGSNFTTYGFVPNTMVDEYKKLPLPNDAFFACSSTDYCNVPFGYTAPTNQSSGLKCFTNGQFDKTITKEVTINPPGFTCFYASRPCDSTDVADVKSPCSGKAVGSSVFLYGSGSSPYYTFLKTIMPNLTSCDTGDYCNDFDVLAQSAGTSSTTQTTAAPTASNIKSDGIVRFGFASFVGTALMYAAENLLF